MNNQATIAGVILTLNEEQDLLRALRSISWCDELIVVDSGSEDRTAEIATAFGARFVQHIQKPPFVITDQRNWALESAGITSDWILFLDADEEIGDTLSMYIRACITSQNNPANAYELTPRYWFLGKWLKRTQGYPNWHPRLLKRSQVTFVGGVWESFSSNAHVARIRQPYEHYAFSKGIDNWIERHQRYADWDAKQITDLLDNSGSFNLDGTRFPRLRMFSYRFWIFRAPLRFLQKYVLQLGFLEGWQSLLFCLMMLFYDMITIIKVIESRRISSGKPL